MRKHYPELSRYTWDQAEILGLWPATAFAAVGIKPATVRKWAHERVVTRIGVGPNGAVLYHYDQVARVAEKRLPRAA